jgi:hypothetical protein
MTRRQERPERFAGDCGPGRSNSQVAAVCTTDSAKLLPLPVLLHGRKLLVKRQLLITLAIVGLLAAIPLSRAGAATQSTSDVTLLATHRS